MNYFIPGAHAISLNQHAKNLILDLMLDAANEASSRRTDEIIVSNSESETDHDTLESRKVEYRRVIDEYMSVEPTGIGKYITSMMNEDQLNGNDRSIQSFAFIFYKLETYFKGRLVGEGVKK